MSRITCSSSVNFNRHEIRPPVTEFTVNKERFFRVKTELRDFCIAYSQFAVPLSTTLKDSLERIDSARHALKLGHSRPMMADVQHRLKILVDKLEAQQAYLIIFGPLKSGKSTLMNAISGSYVSEVSSLPAYPCLVYVRDGDQESYSTTSYGGSHSKLNDSASLQKRVEDKHIELAQKLQEAEDAGLEFEPANDYPEALRRIDISLPAADLAKSGVVLVDTPGLYSRMKFGYDLMTRDFRDTAACAVFVVKTENLFLEQVFAEFNELLDVFSRVFLVVNIDAGKKDLAPDGSLRPSAESIAPQKVVEAFESLSMEAPMRKAFENGRLNIYPIDLLGAAAERLSSGDEQAPQFDAFLSDLGNYLNSSDYLVEFKRDSLNQGKVIADELHRIVANETISDIRAEYAQETQKLETLNDKSEAALTASGIDWQKSLSNSRRNVTSEIKALAADAADKLCRDLFPEIEAWFAADESLEMLRTQCLATKIDTEARSLSAKAREAIKSHLGGIYAGAQLTRDVQEALQELDLTLFDADGAPRLALAEDDFSIPGFNLDMEGIPVKRGFFDFLFFRSQAKIRSRLFGADGQSAIPHHLKTRKLGAAAKEFIEDQVRGFTRSELTAALEKGADAFGQNHTDKLSQSIGGELECIRTELDRNRADSIQEIEQIQTLLGLVDGLTSATEDFCEQLDVLRNGEATALPGAVSTAPRPMRRKARPDRQSSRMPRSGRREPGIKRMVGKTLRATAVTLKRSN
jgi:signal recognition particle receptor subunit beta